MSQSGLLHPNASAMTAGASRPRISVALKLTLLVGAALALLLGVLLAGSWFYWREVLRAHMDAHLSAVAASRRDMVQAQVALLLQRVELNTDRGEIRSLLYKLENDQDLGDSRENALQSLKLMANGKP